MSMYVFLRLPLYISIKSLNLKVQTDIYNNLQLLINIKWGL